MWNSQRRKSSMDLKITGIRYENIREFKEVELDFTEDSPGNPHHISLVQMPNGTGKTTTMNLIRTRRSWEEDEGRGGLTGHFSTQATSTP
ncbi:MAG: ATP-binding protein [Natrialbaceae archaeon]|nr:ATP-binding protein [Natrialbaceae archaeon]